MDEDFLELEWRKVQSYGDISGYEAGRSVRANLDDLDSYPAFKAADDYNTPALFLLLRRLVSSGLGAIGKSVCNMKYLARKNCQV